MKKDTTIDIYFIVMSILLLSLDMLSTYYNLFVEYRGFDSNILLFFNIATLLCFIISYILLILKKMFYRVIISLSFTCYMFFITLTTSFFYIIAVYGLLLSVLLFYLTKTKITTKMIYSIICAVAYIIIMILQSTGVIKLEESNLEINSYTNLGVVVIAIILIGGLVVNSYLIYKNRIKKVINIRAVSKKKSENSNELPENNNELS